jgi:PAS domain S-box-containing protein
MRDSILEALTSALRSTHAAAGRHQVRFYEDETQLFEVVADFLAKGLKGGDGVLLIATAGHRAGFERALAARGISVPAARAGGQLIELDAEQTLLQFMVGSLSTGTPDRDAFMKAAGCAIAGLAQAFPAVRAYGEMVNVLLEWGNAAAATRIEELWNELAQVHSFELYCSYRMGLFASAERSEAFRKICSLHSRVLPSDAPDDTREADEHLRQIAELRQRTEALQAEVAARKLIEEALRERERELHEFLESATECLQGLSPEGRVLWANQAMLELAGYPREEHLGKYISELHAEPRDTGDVLARIQRGEQVHDQATQLRAKDGSLKEVLVNASGLFRGGRLIQVRWATRDVTERKRAEETRARLAAIVESSDDAIVSKSLDGIITSWNAAAERMFGYTAAEAIGQSIYLIIPEDRRVEELDVLARLRRGEKVDHFETIRRTKQGELRYISLTVSPVRDGTGRIIGASKVARDITGQKRAEAERQNLLEKAQEARKEAERALQSRDEFLATVSHELRSPLNAIVGWTHLLRTGGLDREGTRRAIETIHRNAMVQNQLIADILDVQRLSSGKLRLNMREAVDLALAVEAAIDTVRPAAHAKGITITPAVHDVPTVPADPERIQQIVWNLLSNAVKFTPDQGEVEVALRDAGTHVEIKVQDSGPGIKPEFLPFVFERFRQDASTGRRNGGLGLGLAIVRHITELHGGTVSAANREEGGALFTVRLPRAYSSGARVEAVLPSDQHRLDDDAWLDSAPSLHGIRVLLVDDEADAREVLAAVLGQCGADVTVATSASDVMTLFARERPDVLVCDIEMPDEDGYSLLRRIRALPQSDGSQVPAVALTAFTTPEHRLRALRAGFQMHVPKPVQPGELAAVVASLAARQQL